MASHLFDDDTFVVNASEVNLAVVPQDIGFTMDDAAETELAAQTSVTSEDMTAKRRHNETSQLCSLPLRSISRILLYTRDDHRDPPSLAWLPVTHVCHNIRTVALAFPFLWDHIHAWREDLWITFLQRSAGFPIDVHVGRRAQQHLVAMVLEQLPRIRSLDMNLSIAYEATKYASWLGLAAPHLVSVSIRPDDDRDSGFPLVPELLACNSMPSLQSLDVVCRSWRWMYTAFPNTLTCLSVCTGFPWMSDETIAEQALSVLHGLPLLESLSILDPFPESGGAGNHGYAGETTRDTIFLPKLKSLRTRGAIVPCLRLPGHLSIPSKCQIRVETSIEKDQPDTIFGNLLNKNVCVPVAQSAPIVELSLWVQGTNGGQLWIQDLKTERTTHPERASAFDADFVLQCLNADRDSVLTWEHMMYSLVGNMALPSVRTLELFPLYREIHQTEFRRAFRQMPNIGTIHFCHWALHMLLLVIPTFLEIEDDNGGDEPQIFLPHLRQLVICNVDFPDRHDLHIAEFIHRLRTRRERGLGVTTITLRCCRNVTPTLIDSLRGEVDEVFREVSSTAEHARMVWEDIAGPESIVGPSEIGEFEEDDSDFEYGFGDTISCLFDHGT